MKDESWPILWKGELVGWLEQPYLDHFLGGGRFAPGDAKFAALFLDAVNADTYDVVANFGGIDGLVTGPLDEEGELWFNHWHPRQARTAKP